MRKLPIAIVGALAASLLFSGCFFLRTLNFSKDKTNVGEPRRLGDDGDGVPEDDEASCTGFSSSSLIVTE